MEPSIGGRVGIGVAVGRAVAAGTLVAVSVAVGGGRSVVAVGRAALPPQAAASSATQTMAARTSA
jgi:hypothetical protein